MVTRAKFVFGALILSLIFAACGGGNNPTDVPTAAIEQGPSGQQSTPLPEAPEWRSPSAVITRENVAQAELLGRLDVQGRPSTLFAFKFSPDSTQLAALNSDQVLVWDLISGERILTNSRLEASTIYYAPDKTEIYTITSDGFVRVYDAENLQVINSFVGLDNFSGVAAFDFENNRLALGGLDGTIRVWQLFERASLVTFKAHQFDITRLVFSPDGTRLASASVDGVVLVWDWQAREVAATLNNENVVVRNMTFSPDGERLAVGTIEFINLWNVANAEYLFTLQTGSGGANDVLMYSPDGRYLINGGNIPDMIIWDAEAGELVALLPGVGGDVTSASFSPDSSLLLASVLDGPVTLWDMTQITAETVVRADLSVGTTRVFNVAFTDDSFVMLFFDAIGPVYVWGIPPGDN